MKLKLNKTSLLLMFLVGALISVLLPIIASVVVMGVIIFIAVACISSEQKQGVVECAALTWMFLGMVFVQKPSTFENTELLMWQVPSILLGLIASYMCLRGFVKFVNNIEKKQELSSKECLNAAQ